MRVAILLANGYEEVEALTVVDYLRRAEITVDMVSTTGSLKTIGDHDIAIMADKLLADVKASDYDLLVTPGGFPGSEMLASNDQVIKLLQDQHQEGRYIASICASPLVLDKAGISQEIKGTCFPGLEGDKVHFADHQEDLVVQDKEQAVITSRGPATAVYFALAIIDTLLGKEKRDEIAEGLLLPLVEDSVKSHD
ncbi:DJ-1 family glyoxalase III [Aerococcus kribbianus]|uniref:DJ-1/PfpI family protein n=1 Tax=Aerococcus kribbianus TaxID=2999064 RepID=A0A9X3FP50_9LACT|nr:MULTISPECIES: DJ-1 family glyoxalase III [unclassified Aerococcus]MCZ0717986.1 DJ-1/PfpI family protein [Aerococcus sp. YH-aer221]MCZ0726273.1 DJ-1/PfpI family protein [Aerococcus sp. YH-aer222]